MGRGGGTANNRKNFGRTGHKKQQSSSLSIIELKVKEEHEREYLPKNNLRT